MRIFLVWTMLAFALLPAPLSAQSLKESAALLPVSFLGLPQTQAQFLLNRLQERLSTEFTLVAQSEVADAFDRAVKALPGAECTEENCLALLQQYLKVSLVFNLQVVQDKEAGLTQLSLSLTEGRRRTVRTELCESCSIKALLNSLDKVTGTLLLERRRDRQVAQAKPGIGVEPKTLELREGGVSGTLAVSVQSPLGGRVVLDLQSDPVGLGFQPSQLEFDPSNWSEPQTVEVFAPDDEAITGTQEMQVRVLVVEAGDMNYGFVDPSNVGVMVLEDDEQGRLEVLSRPNEAGLLLDGHALRDGRGAPRTTPAILALPPGTHTLTLKRPGYKSERITVQVNRTNLGTRSVVLHPVPSATSKPPKSLPAPQEAPASTLEKPEAADSQDYRLRVLYGSFSSKKTSASQSALHLEWQGFGLGLSSLSYQHTSASENRYSLSGRHLDLSYTFGKGWFYTLGLGLPAGGSGSVTTSTGTYQTSKFGGSTFSGLVGTGWGGIEGWLGYKAITLQYTDFQQDGTTLGNPFAVSLGLLVFGIGGSF